MLEHLHFIRPFWLLALLPLVALAWIALRPAAGANAWRRVVDARLLPLMMAGGARGANWGAVVVAASAWAIAAVALADPAWSLKPRPVFQTRTARVVVLDLSSSMNDADLKPSRLTRARYKVEDVLSQAAEGQTALVAYAGAAFTVAPLTRDVNTIRSLLKVLEPDLMPADGNRADLGLRKAGDLLHQAGVTSGQVLLIADGVDTDKSADAAQAAARLRSEGYTVSVLGVGTREAVPLTNEQGRLVRTGAGDVQAPQMDVAALQAVARAGGGQYQPITDDGQGLRSLLDAGSSATPASAAKTKSTVPAWLERGPLLAVLLLPLAALAFRRNWLVSAALLAVLAAPAQATRAASWSDAWQRPDQQASQALAAGDYAKAAAVARDPARRGSAEYKRGNYQLALDDFVRATGPDADYDRGNALARLGRYQDAIAAYDKAIGETSSNEDAKANKAAVEALLKQKPPPQPQRQQQQQQSAGSKGSSKPGSDDQNGGLTGQTGQSGRKNQGGQSSQGQGEQPGASPRQGAGSPSKGWPGDSNSSQSGTEKRAESGNQPSTRKQYAQANLTGAKSAGNNFAQAAQQVGKPANGQSGAADAHPGNADGRKPQPSSAGAANRGQPGVGTTSAPTPSGDAQPIEGEEKQAAEQWLRNIPDDPGGLLRRKFLNQYRQQAMQPDSDDDR